MSKSLMEAALTLVSEAEKASTEVEKVVTSKSFGKDVVFARMALGAIGLSSFGLSVATKALDPAIIAAVATAAVAVLESVHLLAKAKLVVPTSVKAVEADVAKVESVVKAQEPAVKADVTAAVGAVQTAV